jgi:hypothetical protein
MSIQASFPDANERKRWFSTLYHFASPFPHSDPYNL